MPKGVYLRTKPPWNTGTHNDPRAIKQGKLAWETRLRNGTTKVWNEGLTKDTDERVARNAKSIKRGYDLGRVPYLKQEGSKVEKTKEILSKKQTSHLLERWKNSNYREEQLTRLFSRRFTRPNKLEIRLIKILDKFFPEYKFTGNNPIPGSNIIPDFINDSRKKIIELFGDYWHNEEKTGRNRKDEEDYRKEKVSELGFDCMIIWQSELDKMTDSEIIEILNYFTFSPQGSYYINPKLKLKIKRAIRQINWREKDGNN